MALPSTASPNNDLSVPVLLRMMRFLYRRASHPSLGSISAYNLELQHPLGLAKTRRSHIHTCCRVGGGTAAFDSILGYSFLSIFHSRGTFHSVLVKNASHHVSAYGQLAFRPRLLSRAPACFTSDNTFYQK